MRAARARYTRSRPGGPQLDAFGNQTIVGSFAASELVAASVSEEMDEPRQVACGRDASYILSVDPLDGSSNSDVNGVVATIFGIYRLAMARYARAYRRSDPAKGAHCFDPRS